ncbi:MAG: ABC transporter substrate-binding protein [Synergistaceae bacterium]|jgi:NitT/TauT family transport system substrate-binding protein|nr:ABC transporter substrate-binding protein [Synergistaceae bacterium]
MRNCLLKPLFIALLALLAWCLPACAENIPELTDVDKKYTIKLGYYNCDHMTAAPVADAAGIYKELGLKVDITGNGKVPEAMAAAQMDVGYVSNRTAMLAFQKGAPIVVAANNHSGGSYYLVVSNKITASRDLLGKKLSLGTSPEKNSISWVRMARRLNLPAEGTNYEVFNMSDHDEYFAMKVGQLDGYTACDPWASMAIYEKTGRILEADLPSLLPDKDRGICCAYIMRQSFIREHPALAVRMIIAHVRGIEYIYTNPLKSAEIFAEAYSVPLEVGLMTIHMKTVQEGRTLTWKVERNRWESEVRQLIEIGNISESPDLDKYLYIAPLEESGVDDFDSFIAEKVDPVFPVGMPYEKWKAKAYELAAAAR